MRFSENPDLCDYILLYPLKIDFLEEIKRELDFGRFNNRVTADGLIIIIIIC